MYSGPPSLLLKWQTGVCLSEVFSRELGWAGPGVPGFNHKRPYIREVSASEAEREKERGKQNLRGRSDNLWRQMKGPQAREAEKARHWIFPSELREENSLTKHLCFNPVNLILTFWPSESVVVQALSPLPLFVNLWTAACQAPSSFTVSWRLPRLVRE